ncbi:transcription factor bHLH19-like [Vicia villosa]|uniref:transcription factor bHLH19-like n=1 Tax=Vicia villosa TaxID=3911 RepID=UPI00273C7106|nr:transcription factor bHLH19-like [Vicia villosa]
MIQISSSKYMPEFGMEDTRLFEAMDSFAFDFDDIPYFNSFSASTPESTNSSHNNKRFHSESTQNNSFPNESPNQSVASATPPTKLQLKASSSSKIISFDNKEVKKPKTELEYGENLNFGSEYDKRDNKVVTTITNRNPIQARDHVLAERKRRQKLNQKLITLSSILPGLKKMDKATILEDAINHLNQLKERVKSLEEQVADRKVESAVYLKRSILFSDDDCDEYSDQSVPKIEARVSGKDMLIRIHCHKHTGRIPTAILNKLEKLDLTIQSSSVLQFGSNYIDITIVAQMNKEYCLTIKDLIRSISQVLKQLV